MGRDLRVVPAEELWNRGRDSSHDGERDIGLMVTDFIETGGGGSGGAADSWCSSDSDSGFPDPTYLSDKIQVSKLCQNFQNMRRGRGKGRKQGIAKREEAVKEKTILSQKRHIQRLNDIVRSLQMQLQRCKGENETRNATETSYLNKQFIELERKHIVEDLKK